MALKWRRIKPVHSETTDRRYVMRRDWVEDSGVELFVRRKAVERVRTEEGHVSHLIEDVLPVLPDVGH